MRYQRPSPDAIGRDLLRWYDHHARQLPWRVGPADRLAGVLPDPYRVWLSEIMLQQTTVAAVAGYFERFTTLWPNVDALAAADDAQVMGEWAGLGYYARARNLLKCARAVMSEHGGRFPQDYDSLLRLPGIGPYTAAAIASIAFDRPEAVMDGNVERVVARLFDIHTPLPAAKPDLKHHATALTPKNRPGDHAQAMMDLGATICTPKRPACGICPVLDHCVARRAGTSDELPRKSPKKSKPTRHGTAYIAQRDDGALLLETRPQSGLLGGMLGWPGGGWDGTPDPGPPCQGDWAPLGEDVRHTFTHFHLVLRVHHAKVPDGTVVERGEFAPIAAFRPSDLPTVMRKAFDLWRNPGK